MGKLGPRLGSRKKAKRWAKGQSASCNPETQKYRNQALLRFSQSNKGSTGLTTESLQKHNAVQGLKTSNQIEIDDDESSTGTFKTYDTFASDYSNCSNISFSRFLNHFQTSSAIHKEMLAILAAITDVIKQQGGTESSTEYYAALMTSLEQVDNEESMAAHLSLLGMGLKTVPKNVLKVQFSQASHKLFQILTKYAASDNYLILRHCIGCLSHLLRVQEAAIWSNHSTIQVLDGILAFTVYAKPKVRKAAQHAICAILKGSDIMKIENNPPAYHPAAPHIAKHCLGQFENAGQPGTITTTLHVLTLLKDIVHQLPKSHVKSICEGLLRIMTLNNPLITSCCLQTFHSLFVSRPPETVLPPQLNAQIINALYDYQPAPGDTQPTLAWLAVMQEAHSNLVMNSEDLCASNISRIIEKAIELWISDNSEIVAGTSHTIKALLQICIVPLCDNETSITKYKTTVTKVIQLIRMGLKYQYNGAWHHVLHLIAVLFQIAGATCQKDLSPILIDLADLRDSHKFTYNSEVEYAVGAAVKSMGPELVLAKIPLQTSADAIDLRRSWLLPVLKDCVNNASLSYFINSMLPLAVMCEKKCNELKEKNDGIGAHSYELLTSQIWALLPSFCNNPRDIKDSFKSIARILGTAISERKDLRLSVMASLRKLITRSVENDNKDDVNELAKFAKNYLPLLFNLYTIKPNGSDEEGQRLAAFDTIKIYLTITSIELCGELFDKALEKLQEPNTDEFIKQAIYDLIRILTQYTDETRLQGLYKKCLPIFMSKKHPKEQKKAYRFLEEICASERQVCKEFVQKNYHAIQKVLIEASATLCTISKGARLRCIDHLFKNYPIEINEYFKTIVPEIVISTKELNEKCRATAYQLINNIADKLMSDVTSFNEYIQMLIVGLGGTPVYISATLLALANLTYTYNGSVGVKAIQEILGHTCNLLTTPTREIVLSALSYIKVYLSSLPTIIIGPNLSMIVQSMTKMTDDCKRHFRQKVRDILVKLVRKFGINIITDLVPASEEVLHKRLKNIRKIETRKQKAKEEKNSKGNDENDDEEEFNVKRRPKTIEEILADSDEEFDEVEDNDDEKSKKKGVRKAWIQENAENIVDLIDPSATKSITATKPGQSNLVIHKKKSKNSGFKMTEDGKLIIRDNDDDDDDDDDDNTNETTDNKKKKKNKLPFLGGDSEDDEDREDDEDDEDGKSVMSLKPGKRKRKLSGSTAASTVANSTYQAGGTGIHRPIKQVKVMKTAGAEYKSKKAKGDIKKKGKPDPYAYVPLTRAALNKRKKMKSAGRFKNIISGAKKGAKIGSKGKRRKQ
ncbi:hypothetical protein PV325_012542 [Microctonus aethiopoides]|uniref:RRP12-like protein n=1 Tax=Microctonus aethiopoides TaxID=144406 RepID=A0AA39F8I9_9HYME|nr:hypothetical protein PV325_012542 [Microctonus aethiopoides]KAK0164925.1 hypothetical protein PV328_003491 [Microctonus aethiopoides]